MNERPTPETDAEHAKFAMGGFTLDFCRKLERERDEAREELHDIRLNLGEDADGYTLLHAVCVLQNERNEAMEDSLEQARLLGMGSEREAKLISDLEFRRGLYKVQEQYLETARRERDEAREECKEAQYESEQQSRLLGISAEREYALRGKIFELERKILQLEAK